MSHDLDLPANLDHLPTIVVDTREQTPLPFRRLRKVTDTLYTGDYSILGGENSFAIERKSIADLIGSITAGRERFEHELLRLRGVSFRRLLIIGSREDIENGRFRSKMDPRSALASIAAFESRYNIPVVYAPTPEEGGRLVESWASWVAYEAFKVASGISRGGRPPKPSPAPARPIADPFEEPPMTLSVP